MIVQMSFQICLSFSIRYAIYPFKHYHCQFETSNFLFLKNYVFKIINFNKKKTNEMKGLVNAASNPFHSRGRSDNLGIEHVEETTKRVKRAERQLL